MIYSYINTRGNYRPGARGIRRNISRSDDIFRGALCPEENIITEGNIAEPPSGGSINDKLYRKLKNSLSSE